MARQQSGTTRQVLCALAALGIAALTLVSPALAVEPDEVLSDPALEGRARALSAQLRCLVCQNQSIDDSSAPLARDLRILVRERLKAGDSDAAVKAFVVDRYGTFVLLKPPFQMNTLVLWLAPLALVLAAAAVAWRFVTRGAEAPQKPAPKLTAEEEARLEALLAGSEDRG
jgi:cytochrome c-type biogenesis protein CcmH